MDEEELVEDAIGRSFASEVHAHDRGKEFGGRWDVRGGIRSLLAQASAHTALPFVIAYEGRFAGQLTVSGISYGALSSATLGYWVAREFAGKGLATVATAMATDHCLQGLGLHRMEVCIRPENILPRDL